MLRISLKQVFFQSIIPKVLLPLLMHSHESLTCKKFQLWTKLMISWMLRHTQSSAPNQGSRPVSWELCRILSNCSLAKKRIRNFLLIKCVKLQKDSERLQSLNDLPLAKMLSPKRLNFCTISTPIVYIILSIFFGGKRCLWKRKPPQHLSASRHHPWQLPTQGNGTGNDLATSVGKAREDARSSFNIY